MYFNSTLLYFDYLLLTEFLQFLAFSFKVFPQQLLDWDCVFWGAELLVLYSTLSMYYTTVSPFFFFASIFADLAMYCNFL
jgi:hypothetical protein